MEETGRKVQWWRRMGELEIAEAVRESGVEEDKVSEFREVIVQMGAREKFYEDDFQRFVSICKAWPAPANDDRIGVLKRYWICFLMAVLARGSPGDAGLGKITTISLNSVLGRLDEDEAMALCVNLSSNSNVQKLFLQFQRAFGTPQVCELMGQALKVNTAMKELLLWAVDMDEESVASLMYGLESNTVLEILRVPFNDKIGNSGIVHVARMLRENSSLKMLDLHHTGLGLEGVKSLTCALAHNVTLKSLRLGWDPITEEGMKLVLELFTPGAGDHVVEQDASPTNTTISDLQLDDLGRDDFAVDALVLMIRKNKSLLSLSLVDAPVGMDDWSDKIIPALEENDSLKRLDLQDSKGLPYEAFMNLVTLRSSKCVLEEIELGGTNLSDRSGIFYKELRRERSRRREDTDGSQF